MSGTARALLTMMMVGCAVDVAQAQHDTKPAQGHAAPAHAAPAAEKAAASATKPAAHHAKPAADPHGAKPAAPAPEHAPPGPSSKTPTAKAPAAKPAGSSVEHAVARVMQALDRELGKPEAGSARARRQSPKQATTNKIAVSWKMQLAWPETDPASDTLRVQWPDPVLESVPLRVSYIGFPK